MYELFIVIVDKSQVINLAIDIKYVTMKKLKILLRNMI